MPADFLTTIRPKVQQRVLEARKTFDDLEEKALAARQPHNFLEIFHTQPALITEIKFASPSLGTIRAERDPLFIARDYLEHGASALSILTEPHYFNGSLEYLRQVRQAFPEAKLLMKDFVLDESQLLQARVEGADAVLLIVAFLEEALLEILYQKALELGLTPLLEVHDPKELEVALRMSPRLIGINNRNLSTLAVDIEMSKKLAAHVPKTTTAVSESGLKDGATLKMLMEYGYKGFLMGTHLMQSPSPGKALQAIRQEI